MVEAKNGKRRFYLVLALLLLVFSLSGCGSKKSAKSSSNYKDTKHMVIDILKTPEGKKAVTQASKGESASTQSKDSGSGGGSSDGGGGSESSSDSSGGGESGGSSSSGMKTQSQDVEKLVKQENKKMLKTFSSDPEFQKAVIAAMKTPEVQNTLRIEMLQMMSQMQQGLMKTKSKSGGGSSAEGGDGGSEGGGGESKGKMGQ